MEGLLFLRKDPVGFLQRFLGADVVPEAGDGPGVDGSTGVKPLDEAAGLVGVVAFFDVLFDEGQRFFGIVVEGNAGQGAGGDFGFFFEVGDFAGGVDADGVVFFDLFEAADVVNGEDGSFFLAGEFAEIFDALAEEVVASDDDEVVVHVFFFEDEIDVADGAEFVGVVSGAVVDDFEVKFGFRVAVGPFLEVVGELGVGDDVNHVHADGGDVVDDVFDHRFAGDGQKRFGLGEGEWIKAGGVSCG